MKVINFNNHLFETSVLFYTEYEGVISVEINTAIYLLTKLIRNDLNCHFNILPEVF